MTLADSSQASTKYRPDIDGLRGLSIIFVLIFHLFPSLLPGGYLGVDVFFVISGFIITTIIVENRIQEKFVTRFYWHRVRRLFPALIVVVAFCLLFGWLFLFSHEYKQLGLHAARAGVFSINFKLYEENGYFEAVNDEKPLMHLWSLSVEEQFYLLYPVLLILVLKTRRAGFVLGFLSVILLAALAYNYQENDSKRAFYFISGRLWELIAGALLAYSFHAKAHGCSDVDILKKYRMPDNSKKINVVKDVCGVIGLSLIVFAAMSVRSGLLGGGVAAVCGTLLLIANQQSVINRRWLSWRPLVFVGLISYPLYLWHWPIYSFAYIINGEMPQWWIRFICLIAAFVLAVLTWAYIESPIRRRPLRRIDVGLLLVGATILVGFGTLINVKDGFPTRSIEENYAEYLPDGDHSKFFNYIKSNYYECQPSNILDITERHLGVARCAQSKKFGVPEIIIIGDSHGEHLYPGLSDFLHDQNIGYYSFRCLPFFGVSGHPSCAGMADALEWILQNRGVKVVILAASWPGKIAEKSGLSIQNNGLNFTGQEMLGDGLHQTVERLVSNNKRVIVVGDTPNFPYGPKKCVIRPLHYENSMACSQLKEAYVNENIDTWRTISNSTSAIYNSYFFNLEEVVCESNVCSMKRNSMLLYRDNDHLSLEGSRIAGTALGNKVKELGWLN